MGANWRQIVNNVSTKVIKTTQVSLVKILRALSFPEKDRTPLILQYFTRSSLYVRSVKPFTLHA